jgi:hypothetical protein
MKIGLDSPGLEQCKVLEHTEDGNSNFLFDQEWGIIVSIVETLRFPM